MVPILLPGIALAGKLLLSKYNDKPLTPESKVRYRQYPNTTPGIFKMPAIKNPLNTLYKGLTSTFRGITSTLSQITSKPVEEDYTDIVKRYIPDGGRLITPQYPAGSDPVKAADLDNDSLNELIASYKLNDQIKTIILKKRGDRWSKLGEINNSDYASINYRGVSDITGKGTDQLLIGNTSKDKVHTLHSYSFENNEFREIFTRSYHRLQILNQPKTGNIPAKAQLAVWTRKDDNTYNIEVLTWNGSKLEPVKNTVSYYYKNAVPYFVEKVKRAPGNPYHWYNLADALAKGGVPRDAVIAADVGLAQSSDPGLREKFTALKNQVAVK